MWYGVKYQPKIFKETRMSLNQNEELKEEYWSRVRMEKTSARKEKWENAFNGRRTDSVQERIPVVFNHGSHSGQRP